MNSIPTRRLGTSGLQASQIGPGTDNFGVRLDLPEGAVGGLLARPVVASVIAGATSAEQVDANVAVGTAWALSADEGAQTDALQGAA